MGRFDAQVAEHESIAAHLEAVVDGAYPDPDQLLEAAKLVRVMTKTLMALHTQRDDLRAAIGDGRWLAGWLADATMEDVSNFLLDLWSAQAGGASGASIVAVERRSVADDEIPEDAPGIYGGIQVRIDGGDVDGEEDRP